MKILRMLGFVASLLVAFPAAAQWQVPNNAVPLGRGAGVTGFGSAAPGAAGSPLVSNGATLDPSFQLLPNSGLISPPANTFKCNPTIGTAPVQDCALGSGVAAAIGNGLNGLNGLVGFSGNIGAASGTSLALGGCTIGSMVFCVTGQSQINNTFSGSISGAQSATGLYFNTQVGGSGLTGTGPVSGGYSLITEGTPGSTAIIDKIGWISGCVVAVSDTAGGGCYGGNDAATVNGGGAAINRLVGREADLQIKSGSGAVNYRYGYSSVNETLGASAATTLDTAYLIGNAGLLGGAWLNGLTASNSLGQVPIAASFNWFQCDYACTFSNFASFANATVTGYILNFPGAQLTGGGGFTTGNAVVSSAIAGAPAITSGKGGMWGSATGGLNFSGLGSSFDITINNGAGQNVCVVGTGTRTLSCNTMSLTNAMGVGSGGTGLASYTIGDVLYATGSTTLASLADIATGNALLSGGVGVAPSYGKVGLTTHVTGTLPVANGGTGDTGTAWTTFTPSLSCGTATFTVNSATSKTIGKTTFAQIDYTISAIGTCTNGGVTFTLPNTPQTSGALNGQEIQNSSAATSCVLASGSATATCRKTANAAALLNDHVVISGVYQNQ